MIIQNETALASLMSRSLAAYANRVQNGQIKPFLGFMKGETSVVLNVVLGDDGVLDVKVFEPVVQDLIITETEVESPVLEATEAVDDPIAKEMLKTELLEEVKPKSKSRKRKA